MGRCDRCGVEGTGSGVCPHCAAHMAWMEANLRMLEDAKKLNYDLHMGIYHDGGCCGCTQGRRRVLMLAIAAGFAIGGFVALGNGTGGGMPAALFVGAVLFLVCALLCPNGPCGMYSHQKKWGVLTWADVQDYLAVFRGGGGGGGGSGGADASTRLLGPSDVEAGTGASGVAVAASADVGSDAASQRNVAALQRYFHLFNAPDEAGMVAFVAAAYADNYASTDARGTVRHKGDLPDVFHRAWASGWKATDVRITAVKPEAAVYAYTLTFPNAAPARVRATAAFEAPGVFRSSVHRV